MENLRHNPAIEINVVDPISRKGYRFKGAGTVFTEGSLFDEALAFYRRRGVDAGLTAGVKTVTEPIDALGIGCGGCAFLPS